MRPLVPLLAAAGLLLAAAPGADAALRWRSCPGRSQCASLRLPEDYARPHGKRVRIALARLPARDRAHRIGSLFVNFGGPGGTGVDTVEQVGPTLFSTLNGRFDIVGFDPRGVGRSRPALDCKVDQEKEGVYAKPFFRPGFSAARLIRSDRRYVRRCVRLNRGVLPYVSTANVARDLDRMRAAVGDAKLSYLGFSYGTFLGATYSSLFPAHVRALVLDGALDPDQYVNHPLANLDDQTAGFELALGRFLAACKAHPGACLHFGAGHPAAAFDHLVRRLNRHPLRVRGRRVRVDGDDVLAAAGNDLYAKQSWPDLAAALVLAGRRHDGTLLRDAVDEFYGYLGHGRYDPSSDRYFLIGAIEQRYPHTLGVYFRSGRASYHHHPHFWWNHGYSELSWGLFPVKPRGVFRGPFTTPASAPTTLVVGTTFDPATPYDGNRAAARELGNARLLTMEGDGHTAYGGNSACIDAAVDAYLIAGTLPPVGKRCRQHVSFGQPLGPGRAGVAAAGRPAADPREDPAFIRASRMR